MIGGSVWRKENKTEILRSSCSPTYLNPSFAPVSPDVRKGEVVDGRYRLEVRVGWGPED